MTTTTVSLISQGGNRGKQTASSGQESHSWFELPALHDLWNKGHRVPATEESN